MCRTGVELFWAETAWMAITARSIAELHNVFGYVLHGEHAVFTDPLFDTLLLQARGERLGYGALPPSARH